MIARAGDSGVPVERVAIVLLLFATRRNNHMDELREDPIL